MISIAPLYVLQVLSLIHISAITFFVLLVRIEELIDGNIQQSDNFIKGIQDVYKRQEWDGLDPVEPLPTEAVDPGEGFTENGNLVTRDLLHDKATNKQFITVQTGGGNTFYIVIDSDKPTDEDGEQYQTSFLHMVDEADLLAAMQAAGGRCV